ncbi:MAG: methionine--tRNA ligase [Patescibacteria group bacterium]|nr:methionine--tRNA ligase [Patescibacteria group bacterium]MCX7589680.1 methionine--tRNA ligase [Patescibacteria group bacterium]MDW8279800.1 methionine--tRNA ligase [bacterium]
MKKFYITTTLPYVNASLHIGHSLEFVFADIIARFKRQQGYDVIFNTGTDEHGLKIYRTAISQNKNPQEYVDEQAEKFKKLIKDLNLSVTNFIRTTDQFHIESAKYFWNLCKKNGDIYKGIYKAKYCVGCEMEKTDSELENNKCPLHPNLELEIFEEENYFFRFSKYQNNLLKLYENQDFILPLARLNEIKNFVSGGLQDFSISRLKSKMPWGIDVPDDNDHVMYVWFDALINYISTLGWPNDLKKFNDFWPGIQIAGKDNLRQQSAIWQAMLLSAGLLPSQQIIIHGFITIDGQKISKTIGNVIYPEDIIKKYSNDALRFWFASEIGIFDDGDFSLEKFDEVYNAKLVNGLGNFYSRVLALAEKIGDFNFNENIFNDFRFKIDQAKQLIYQKMENYLFKEALSEIWSLIAFGDLFIDKTEPWKDFNKDNIYNLIVLLDNIGYLIYPFMPETSEIIQKSILIENNIMKAKRQKILFPKVK